MQVFPNLILDRCMQAGLSFWVSSKVAMDLAGLEKAPSKEELDGTIIKKLKETDKDAAAQFEDYHSIVIRTSQNTLEGFDKRKISDSIVKETKQPPIIAKEIAAEVERHLRQLPLKNLSSSLIREIVNAKLIDRKLLDAKMKYTRIGIPIYDVAEMIEDAEPRTPGLLNKLFGDKILQEYALAKALPMELSDPHLRGELYIHHLENFVTCPISFKNNLPFFLKHGVKDANAVTTGPAKYADVAALHAARILLTSESLVGGGVGLDNLNVFLAPYLYRKTRKEMKQVSQNFLYELNKGHHGKEAFSVNLCTEIPRTLKNEVVSVPWKTSDTYGDYAHESRAFMEVFLETLCEGDYEKKPFVWPTVCVKYRKFDSGLAIPKPCYFIKGNFDSYFLYGNVVRGSLGIFQAFTINLPKLAENKTENKFFSGLEGLLDVSRDIAKIKEEMLAKRFEGEMLSFLNQSTEKKFGFLVSFYGLQEFCMKFMQSGDFNRGCTDLAGKIFRFTRKKFRQYAKEDLFFSIGENTDKKASEHFCKYFCSDSEMLPQEKDFAKEIQKYCDAGAFYQISDPSQLKSKDFVFFKLI